MKSNSRLSNAQSLTHPCETWKLHNSYALNRIIVCCNIQFIALILSSRFKKRHGGSDCFICGRGNHTNYGAAGVSDLELSGISTTTMAIAINTA